MEAVFEGRRRLLPRRTDLSFFNWATQSSAANHTPTFQARSRPLKLLLHAQWHAHLLAEAARAFHRGMLVVPSGPAAYILLHAYLFALVARPLTLCALRLARLSATLHACMLACGGHCSARSRR